MPGKCKCSIMGWKSAAARRLICLVSPPPGDRGLLVLVPTRAGLLPAAPRRAPRMRRVKLRICLQIEKLGGGAGGPGRRVVAACASPARVSVEVMARLAADKTIRRLQQPFLTAARRQGAHCGRRP